METVKKSTRSSKGRAKTKTGKDAILKSYREALLKDGRQPTSVFSFCESLGISEIEFYESYASFEAIESAIWSNYFASVVGRLARDSNYSNFSVREKILAFYYTLVDVLRSDRSFVLFLLRSWKNPAVTPIFLRRFKYEFDQWLNSIINEGKTSGEIPARPFIDKQYDKLFWLHLLFILHFWSGDNSASFEKTDAAIEKSVNLAADLIGKGVLDQALDFGKFLYQNSRNQAF
jgi:hypothetical protein